MTPIRAMQTTSLANVNAKLSSFVDSVHPMHERVVITRSGEPVAVLVSPVELESLEETITVLSNPEAMGEIAEAQAAIARGDLVDVEQFPRRTAK